MSHIDLCEEWKGGEVGGKFMEENILQEVKGRIVGKYAIDIL